MDAYLLEQVPFAVYRGSVLLHSPSILGHGSGGPAILDGDALSLFQEAGPYPSFLVSALRPSSDLCGMEIRTRLTEYWTISIVGSSGVRFVFSFRPRPPSGDMPERAIRPLVA